MFAKSYCKTFTGTFFMDHDDFSTCCRLSGRGLSWVDERCGVGGQRAGGHQVSQTTTVAIVAVNVSVLRATTALISAKCFDAEAAKQYCQLNCRTTGVV